MGDFGRRSWWWTGEVTLILILVIYQGLVSSLSCYKCYTVECPGDRYICASMETFIKNELHTFFFIEGTLPKCPSASSDDQGEWTYLQESSPSWIPCTNSLNSPSFTRRDQGQGQEYLDEDEGSEAEPEGDPDDPAMVRRRRISEATCSVSRFQVTSFLSGSSTADYYPVGNVTSWGTVMGCLRREVLVRAREQRLREGRCLLLNSTNYFRGVIDHILRIEHCPEDFCHRSDFCVDPGKSGTFEGYTLGGSRGSGGSRSFGPLNWIVYITIGIIIILGFLTVLVFIVVIKKRGK